MEAQSIEGDELLHQYFPAKDLMAADDWRPVYHLSPAAVLRRIGASWGKLSDTGAQLHDGWRFSDSVESDWYLKNVALLDPSRCNTTTGEYQRLDATAAQTKRASQYFEAITGERYYRMRHIGEMRLQVDAQLMEPPAFNSLSACIAPGDVLLRRMGRVSAALVSSYHRRHPVDGNVAIVRGLRPRQAVWLAFCLNQSLYKSYFEHSAVISAIVRVGIKQLASMPIAERPDEFNALADNYSLQYERLARAEDSLFTLRKAVAKWLQRLLPLEDRIERRSGPVSRFFDAQDLGSQLNFAAADQARRARMLTEEFGCVPLARLAEVNPKSEGASRRTSVADPRVIKIGNLDGQLTVNIPDTRSTESRWRFHKRPLTRFAVLVSTFVQEPKVAILSREPQQQLLASEQLAVLNFHRTAGAYALLMETPLMRQQIARLATGTVQRFVQPQLLEQIVVPVIEPATANQWHNRLIELLEEKTLAGTELDDLYRKMYQTYRQVHPDVERSKKMDAKTEDES